MYPADTGTAILAVDKRSSFDRFQFFHQYATQAAAQEEIMWIPFRLARLALWTLAAIAATGPASAEAWPTRPATVVVPFAAGSSTDTAARILAVGMSEVLGQQVIVENIGGAAGMTGTIRVARAAPDGYYILFGTVDTLAIAPSLQ